MPHAQAPLFDNHALALHQRRARARQTRAAPFLITRCIEDLSERLQDVSRTFARAALIGPFDWRSEILNALPTDKHPGSLSYALTPDQLDASEPYDLIMSLLDLQSLNDVPDWMRSMRAHLAPDGLFVGAMLGGESLSQLRAALYTVDTGRFGAPQPRIHPMVRVRQTAPLLSHVGLALPVIDSDRFTVQYRALTTLLGDMRDLGLSNALLARSPAYLGRHFSRDLTRELRRGGDTPFPVDWEIIWMTGWAPHESQQKPLKPGSAKVGLNTALRGIRDGSLSG